jgi:HK97 family phage major capsid protein
VSTPVNPTTVRTVRIPGEADQRDRLAALTAELRRGDLTSSRLDEIETEADAITRSLDLARRVEEGLRTGRVRLSDDLYGTPDARQRDRGGDSDLTRSLDTLVDRFGVAPKTAERIQQVARPDAGEGTQATRLRTEWAAATSSPDYLQAFVKLLNSPQDAHLRWTDAEHDAFRRADAYRAAQSLSGYVLPAMLDPTILLTNVGSISPIRALARVVTTPTNQWRGITSAGATAEWKAEGAQAGDGTPLAAEVAIPVHVQDVDAIASYEVIEDAVDFVAQMAEVIADALAVHEGQAFITGTGSGQPEGLITGLVAAALAGAQITAQAGEALTAATLYAVQNALGARFSANASWLANIATMNTISAFTIGSANGQFEFPEIRDTPPRLLRKPFYEVSQMDGTINAAATETNDVLVYGDIRSAYTIVDRLGATVEVLPGFGANNRPTGQRHIFMYRRVGAEVVRPTAARVVRVTTAA